MLFAEKHFWPDSLDLAVTFLLLGAMIALTVSGHVLMVLDIRAWLRSLRRALIVVTDHLPHFPRWSRHQTPRCLAAMGLKLPCNQEQLLRGLSPRSKKTPPRPRRRPQTLHATAGRF